MSTRLPARIARLTVADVATPTISTMGPSLKPNGSIVCRISVAASVAESATPMTSISRPIP